MNAPPRTASMEDAVHKRFLHLHHPALKTQTVQEEHTAPTTNASQTAASTQKDGDAIPPATPASEEQPRETAAFIITAAHPYKEHEVLAYHELSNFIPASAKKQTDEAATNITNART